MNLHPVSKRLPVFVRPIEFDNFDRINVFLYTSWIQFGRKATAKGFYLPRFIAKHYTWNLKNLGSHFLKTSINRNAKCCHLYLNTYVDCAEQSAIFLNCVFSPMATTFILTSSPIRYKKLLFSENHESPITRSHTRRREDPKLAPKIALKKWRQHVVVSEPRRKYGQMHADVIIDSRDIQNRQHGHSTTKCPYLISKFSFSTSVLILSSTDGWDTTSYDLDSRISAEYISLNRNKINKR